MCSLRCQYGRTLYSNNTVVTGRKSLKSLLAQCESLSKQMRSSGSVDRISEGKPHIHQEMEELVDRYDDVITFRNECLAIS